MQRNPLISIVDDDFAYADSLALLLRSMGYATATFNSAEAFCQQFDPQQPGCLILDVRMPTTNGLSLQEQLSKLPLAPAVLIMSGFAQIPTALRAIRQGAIEFLEKPVSEAQLFDAIERAINADHCRRKEYERHQAVATRFAQLKDSETEVLKCIIEGMANKCIANALGISQRTVEDRRSRIMHKLGVDSISELIQLAIEAGFGMKQKNQISLALPPFSASAMVKEYPR